MIELGKCYPERVQNPGPNTTDWNYTLLTYKGEVYIQLEDVIDEMGVIRHGLNPPSDKRKGLYNLMERRGMPLIDVKQVYVEGIPTRVFRMPWMQVRALEYLEKFFIEYKKNPRLWVLPTIQGEVLTEYLSRRTAKGYQWDGDAFPPYVEPFQNLPTVRDTGD